MPEKRMEYIREALNASNSSVPGGFTDPITGLNAPGNGVCLGDFLDITDLEAKSLSQPGTTLYGGRYRRVRVDPGATAANIKQGTLASFASTAKGSYVVTSYDQGLAPDIIVGVFLLPVTPGNYTWIQQDGTTTVLGKATLTGTPVVGAPLAAAALGTSDVPATANSTNALTIGQALDLPVANALFRMQLFIPKWQG
jgi:hypothetical protein